MWGVSILCRVDPAWWPGGDRLSRSLSCSTMGAEVFHGRVRDGIGCIILAMTTGPPGRTLTDSRTDGGAWDLACVRVCVGWVEWCAAWCCARQVWMSVRTNTLAGAVLGCSGARSGD